MTEVRQNSHVRAAIIGLSLWNLLGVLVSTPLGGWAFLPALIWFLTVPIILAKQQSTDRFGRYAVALYGKFLLWGIASLLLFMIVGVLLSLGTEYLDSIINRGP